MAQNKQYSTHCSHQVLFFFTFPIARGIPGELEAILNSHPLSLEHLVPSLMNFYVGKCLTKTTFFFIHLFNDRGGTDWDQFTVL